MLYTHSHIDIYMIECCIFIVLSVWVRVFGYAEGPGAETQQPLMILENGFPYHFLQHSGVGKCPILGILDITF